MSINKNESVEPWRIPKVEDIGQVHYTGDDVEVDEDLIEEQKLKQAYHEGYQAAKQHFLNQVKKDVQQDKESIVAQKKAELEALIKLLGSPVDVLCDQITNGYMKLMISIVEHVCRERFNNDHGMLKKIAQEAMALLPMQAKNIQLYLHSSDYKKISQYIKTEHINADSIEFIADDTLKPADFRIQSDIAKIDGRIEQRIATIVKEAFYHDDSV